MSNSINWNVLMCETEANAAIESLISKMEGTINLDLKNKALKN